MKITTLAAALLFGALPVRLPDGTQPIRRRPRAAPMFEWQARDNTAISRWTGRPHLHARETYRRRNQEARDRRAQRLRANGTVPVSTLAALNTVATGLSRRWRPLVPA